jgi:uncharacterized protein DUF3606
VTREAKNTAVAAQKALATRNIRGSQQKPGKIDHEKRKRPRDRSKIILESENQVRHWTRHLGVSEQELARAIERVGNSAATVRKQLATSKVASQSK